MMIYRMRIYQAVPEYLGRFNEFFEMHLLPVQLRHGARLIGRWVTDDGQVVAIWQYESRSEYERVQNAVDLDPDTTRARERRATLPPLFSSVTETFMTSTRRENS
jgi:NIPSNAP